MLKKIRISVAVLLLALITYQLCQVLDISKKRQTYLWNYAQVKNIKHGLLNPHSWKTQVSEILYLRVESFEITPPIRYRLRVTLEDGMYRILNDVDRFLDENYTKLGNGLIRLFIQIDQLRRSVPEYANEMLMFLDDPDTLNDLKHFSQGEIDLWFNTNLEEEDLSIIKLIEDKYKCSGIENCSHLLNSWVGTFSRQLIRKPPIIVCLSVLIFLVILLGNKNVSIYEYGVLIAVCGLLIYGGVSTPMIEIDARIESFNITLMGDQIEFENQILFSQSKSILEVVNILGATGEFQSMLVGALIFLFSIVFPFAKLITSFAILKWRKLHKNKVISFLALKSGKWSMADVIVVAIFMSYIGFKGIVQNQLKHLEVASESLEILTTDNSNFGVGFILFLSFCIAGLVLATSIEKQIKRNLI